MVNQIIHKWFNFQSPRWFPGGLNLPLWKIRLHHLGWNSQLNEITSIFQPSGSWPTMSSCTPRAQWLGRVASNGWSGTWSGTWIDLRRLAPIHLLGDTEIARHKRRSKSGAFAGQNRHLVGGWTLPLWKNMSSPIGMMTFPESMGKWNPPSSHHQPAMIFNGPLK